MMLRCCCCCFSVVVVVVVVAIVDVDVNVTIDVEFFTTVNQAAVNVLDVVAAVVIVFLMVLL